MLRRIFGIVHALVGVQVQCVEYQKNSSNTPCFTITQVQSFNKSLGLLVEFYGATCFTSTATNSPAMCSKQKCDHKKPDIVISILNHSRLREGIQSGRFEAFLSCHSAERCQDFCYGEAEG